MEFKPYMNITVRTKEKYSESYSGDSPAHQFIHALRMMPRKDQIEAKKILANKFKRYLGPK